jgi:hypothetical protein
MSNLLVKDDGVEDHHHIAIPTKFICKKDMAQDVRLIFSDKTEVKFIKDNTSKTLEGWWCNPCR